MRGNCSKCGDQELRPGPAEVFLHDLPDVWQVMETSVRFVCTKCGREVKWQTEYRQINMEQQRTMSIAKNDALQAELIKEKYAFLPQSSQDGKLRATVQYPAAFRNSERKLLPTGEGKIQDGMAIDQYGDPDLMMEFAEQYYSQYKAIRPRRRLPGTISEMMPMLHLLVVAVELAMKAFLIRSDRPPTRTHGLLDLYEKLDCEHKQSIEGVFSKSERKVALKKLGIERPTVGAVLRQYDSIYGDGSTVYKETRYYAEPTTVTFKSTSNLHGANLLKGNTPYPIFLPLVAEALIDRFKFYSGSAQLRRRGADILQNGQTLGKDNHGEWSLVPSSLGLVVISVTQAKGISAMGEDLKVFCSFKENNPAMLSTDWRYGGKTIFIYSADGKQRYPDGAAVLEGLECKIWYNERLGMHARDLYMLAEALSNHPRLELRAAP